MAYQNSESQTDVIFANWFSFVKKSFKNQTHLKITMPYGIGYQDRYQNLPGSTTLKPKLSAQKCPAYFPSTMTQ